MGRGRGRARNLSNALRARSVHNEKSRGEKNEEYKGKISPTVVGGIFQAINKPLFHISGRGLMME